MRLETLVAIFVNTVFFAMVGGVGLLGTIVLLTPTAVRHHRA